MKPRKPRAGAATKEILRVAPIRQQIENEKARHAANEIDFALQREEHRFIADPDRRAVREVRRLHQEVEEDRRHRAALKRMHQRISRR